MADVSLNLSEQIAIIRGELEVPDGTHQPAVEQLACSEAYRAVIQRYGITPSRLNDVITKNPRYKGNTPPFNTVIVDYFVEVEIPKPVGPTCKACGAAGVVIILTSVECVNPDCVHHV